MKRIVTCTICPKGCDITVEFEENETAVFINTVTGYTCNRGKDYATNEVTNPVRILSTTVRAPGGNIKLLPVRSEKPIPKSLLFRAMEECSKKEVAPGIKMGDIVIPDIAGTGIAMIACCDT